MLLNVKQVKILLQCKDTKAYNIIRELNEELKSQGYLTRQALIVDDYLYKRYGLDKNECVELLKEVKEW